MSERYYYDLDRRRRVVAALGGSRLLQSGGVKATLDVDFTRDAAWNAGPTSIAALFAYSGGIAGRTYTNADGTLKTTGTAIPYGTNGLLVEEARTNICRQSQTIDEATWEDGATTKSVTANADTAPDGTLTADQINVTQPNNNWLYMPITVTENTQYTASFYAKRGTTDKATYSVTNSSAGESNIVASTSYFSAINTSTYTRIVFTFTTPAGCTSIKLAVLRDQAPTITGTIFIWGVQCEAGAFATSYIPTTTASVTRAADIVTFSDLTWFDGAADSIYAEWVAANINNAKVWAFDATNDKLLDEQTGMSARIAGATVGNTAAAGTTVKAAARMVVNDYAITMNGGTVATDVSETAPGTLTASRLGVDLAGANALNSYIRRVANFKAAGLTNTALQAL